MIEVVLTPPQILMGAHIGLMRQTSNMKNNRNPRYGAGHNNDWQYNIEGCLGEMAVASFLGIYWDGNINRLDRADVGDLEVRTRSEHWHEMLLHEADKDESKHLLVTGKNGSYQLHGWLYGYEGKLDKYWKDPSKKDRPAFFIPQSELRPISELQLLLKGTGETGKYSH